MLHLAAFDEDLRDHKLSDAQYPPP